MLAARNSLLRHFVFVTFLGASTIFAASLTVVVIALDGANYIPPNAPVAFEVN